MKEDLMFCHLGNGVTVCDRQRRKYGDYMKVAHIGKSSVSCPLKPSDSTPLKHSTMPP